MASNAATTPTGFDQWSSDEVKQWIQGWKSQFNVSQSTINNLVSQVNIYQINGMTLLYLTKDDLAEFGLSTSDANIIMERIDYLHKHPNVVLNCNKEQNTSSKSKKQEGSRDEEQSTDDKKDEKKNDDNSKDLSSTKFTEGYLTTKEQEVYICLQKGNNFTKMAIDSSSTVYQLKQKFIQKTKRKIEMNNESSIKPKLNRKRKRSLQEADNNNTNNAIKYEDPPQKKRKLSHGHEPKLQQTPNELLKNHHSQSHDEATNIGDMVLLFMGQVLDDQKTLDYYKIGCTNVTTIFVAERIRSKQSSTKGNISDEAAGIMFINKNDNSQYTLYVDTDMTFLELKNIYKNYLLKQLESKQMKKEAQRLYSQAISFEYSGKKFPDKSLLRDACVSSKDLQYIFVSFGAITENEKDTDDNYIQKIYNMTVKEHKQVIQIKQTFEKSVKTAGFQKSVKQLSQTFKSTSKHQIKSYPQIQDLVKEQTSDHTKKAKEYTKKILTTPPSGKLGKDVNTTVHILSNLFKAQGETCVFYDSREGVKLAQGDSSVGIHEAFQRDKPCVLRLKTLDGLYGITNDDMKDDTKKLIEMQSAIDNGIEHPTLSHVKSKLSAALGVKQERINIIEVFSGSDCFKYTVSNLTFEEKNRMIQQNPTKRLAQQFRQFKELKIHPLLFRPAFDVANFDKRGDKSFVSASGKFQVGPSNMKKEYTQPTGWTRYGLSVLGKYGDDKWLHPFNDAGNWWRAFHGTRNAAKHGVQPAAAMANIHNNGFLPAKRASYGPGVYCSPKPEIVDRGYAAEVAMQIRDNNVNQQKKFKFMLQVAVKPGANTLTPQSSDTIWSVQNQDDIRAYGILIKQVP